VLTLTLTSYNTRVLWPLVLFGFNDEDEESPHDIGYNGHQMAMADIGSRKSNINIYWT
jgi:hypothetical protein